MYTVGASVQHIYEYKYEYNSGPYEYIYQKRRGALETLKCIQRSRISRCAWA